MRILWHAPAPWTPTGYGCQTALCLPRLRDLGHEVIVSAVNQYLGAPLTWEGFDVYPSGAVPYGADVLPGYMADLKPDLLITLTEPWQLDRNVMRGLPAACWTPVDTSKLSFPEKVFFHSSGARPVAMSRHGEKLLTEAGLDPLYVPHAVDTAVFAPQDRAEIRALLNISDTTFAVGILAMNKGQPSRKAFPEQMAGFAAFHKKHPDSLLFLHTQADARDGLNLVDIAMGLGILDACRFTAHHRLVAGLVQPDELAGWYSAMDVLLNATMAEGFGVPIIEAMACGTPVIASRCSAMTELVPPSAGWLTGGIPFWNPTHRAWWLLPDPKEIARALGKALTGAGGKRQNARDHAMAYDIASVVNDYWTRALDALSEARQPREGVPEDIPQGVLGAPPGWLTTPPEDA